MPLYGWPIPGSNPSRPSPGIEMDLRGTRGNREGGAPRIRSGNPGDAPHPNNGSRNRHGWLITKAIAGFGFLVMGGLNVGAAFSLAASKGPFERAADADFNDLLQFCLREVPEFQAHYPGFDTCVDSILCATAVDPELSDAKEVARINPYDPFDGADLPSPFDYNNNNGGLPGRLHGYVPYAFTFRGETCEIPPEAFCNRHIQPASSDSIEKGVKATIAGGVGAIGGGLIALAGLALKNPWMNFGGYAVGTLSLAADIWVVLNRPQTNPDARFDSDGYSHCD